MASVTPALARGARGVGVAVGIPVLAFSLGIVLGAVGGHLGVALLMGVPLAILVCAVILSRPLMGIIAVYVSFPASFLPMPEAALGLQAVEIAVLLVILVVAIRRLGTGSIPLPWSAPMWWGVLFVAWSLAVSPLAADTTLALRQVAQLTAGVLLALAVLAVCRTLQDVRPLVAALLVIGGATAAYGLQTMDPVQARLGGAVVVGRAEGVFTQPGDLGSFSAMITILAIGWTFAARTQTGRFGGAVVAAVAGLALVMTLSRGAWIGTMLAMALMVTLLPRARRALTAVGLPLVLAGAVVMATTDALDDPRVQVVQQRLSSFTRAADNPYDDRPAIYGEAWPTGRPGARSGRSR